MASGFKLLASSGLGISVHIVACDLLALPRLRVVWVVPLTEVGGCTFERRFCVFV